MTILLYIGVGLLPGLFWLWFYYRKDNKRPEPKILLLKVFLLGMVATIPAAGFEILADRVLGLSVSEYPAFWQLFVSTFVIVAPIEEYFKYTVVKRLAYDKSDFNEAFDGIVYMIVASLGFASAENILAGFSKGLDAVALRFVTATLLHALTAGVMGYFLGLAKFNPQQERKLIAQGLVSAIILHGLYNLILVTQTSMTLVLIAILLLFMYFMVAAGIRTMKLRDDRVLGQNT